MASILNERHQLLQWAGEQRIKAYTFSVAYSLAGNGEKHNHAAIGLVPLYCLIPQQLAVKTAPKGLAATKSACADSPPH
jgi:hypothetical protein